MWKDPSDTHPYRLWTLERVPSTASGVELPLAFPLPQEFQSLDLLTSAEENTNPLLEQLGC
ncbi:hypothetical protein [Streptomyces noursei]|uniref:hypothetical protein n=1 Tax=Streptomyces noursei TaxID=1971 RepID=UPI0030F36299